MMKRLLTILSICVLCITAQAQIVIGVTRTGQVGTADQNLEFVDQFGRIMAYPSLGPTGELLDAMRPAVATNLNVSDVTKVSATTGGKVIAEGASAVTECGVCFSTSTNPTTQDAHVTATPDADGNFTVSLTGLQPNTTYHVRAYATNAIGTSYGTDFTFTTRGDANITITGNTDTKTYNGAQQSVTGYTVTIPDGVNIAASEISGPTVTAQGTDVGTYTMSLTAGDFSCSNTNYDVTFTVANGVSLTITRATATVTADAQTKVYGTAEPSFTATVTGLQGNDAASSITYSVTRATGENVGTYAITPNGAAEQGNYNVTYVPANLTITKASATVTPDAKSKTYGAADPELTATVSGTVGSDVLNYTLSRTAGENAGTYDINVNLGDNPNYDVTATKGTFTINKATATVTAADKSKTYGASDPELTATVTGAVNNETLNYTLARATGENAGTYDITVTPGSNPNYEVTTANGTFTINKATAIVTAADKSKTYGASDPELTATVTGAVNNETLNYTLSRANGESAGTYAITVTLGSNPNYEVTAANGTFTINKATATVTADNKSKTYGATDPTLTATVTGVVNNETLNYTLTRANGENAGEYAITVNLGSNPNYEVTSTNGTFTINKATATVTADAKSKTYGAADPELTATVTGAVNNETLNYTLARVTGENAGTYAINVTLGDNPNYEVTTTAGTFTITKATATVTANNASKVYGATDPTFTATVTGVQSGDQLNYTLARATGENAGTYAINVTLGDNPNYEVTTTASTFTITKATATVTANNASKVYGATDPTFTATVTGVQSGDQLNYTLARVTGENAGTYAINVTLGDNPNYEVTTTAGTFTITKATATVTITGNTGSKTYNGREQSVTGYTVGIPSGVNIQQSEISTTATATAKGTNVGTYTMGLTAAAFGTTNGNYDVTFQVTDGSITINRADATVTADNKTKVAGELDPSFTATVTGLQNGETASVLTYTFSRETGEGVGTYAIKPAGDAQQGNYNVTYVNGTLTITEPACPTMGTTTYTPNPVTGSATSITFTTPLINMASGVTVSDASFTVVSDGVANQTLNATYSNGAITAALSGLDNYRDKLIKVTPKVTVSGCSNPGSITGDVVEICVQPVLPSFGTVSNTDATGKTNFFYRKGSYVYATINNYDADLIVEKGFYISSIQSEVQNHSCSPTTGDYGNLDISSYSPSDFRDGFSVVANPTPTATTTALNTRVDISHCNQTTYYRPYMVIRMCGDRDTTIYGTTKSLTMWKPENMTVTANPTTLTSGSAVTLTANADMTIGSYTGSTYGISNATIIKSYFCGNVSSSLFNGIDASTGKASMDTWVQILNQCTDLRNMMGGSGTTMEWSYSWDNGATGKTRTVNAAGTYTAYGNLKLNDETCTVSKNITISTGQ